jgi:2,5-dioxopentanoate dehydrogenase
MSLQDHTTTVHQAAEAAWDAFATYGRLPLSARAALLRTIAAQIEDLGDALLHTCAAETNLPEVRLRNERARTLFQLRSYADACEQGDWLEARIDTADTGRTPPKPDIRKLLVPLGPVAVFGSSNFPFAYSTAGGDTASALAAGCPVIVRAHFAHAQTSAMVAGAIEKAVAACGFHPGIFAHITEPGNEIGRALVMHPRIKAVGFTGSLAGGKAIWAYANERREPIPVFAEMSSVNPVYLLPQKLQSDPTALATQLAASITLGAGQFCTNPGLLIGIDGPALQTFAETLGQAIQQTLPVAMLHGGIADNYRAKRDLVLAEQGVETLATASVTATDIQDMPTVATVSGAAFLQNPQLHTEVFGPFSLLVRCANSAEMLQVATAMEGQLTATMMATEEDIKHSGALTAAIQNHCGRFIVNGVPTGVEVCLSMHHGGPWPSTTDSRFTSVGADAIKRFARPLCFQNCPDRLLPDALSDGNPLGLWRTVNNVLTQDPIAHG